MGKPMAPTTSPKFRSRLAALWVRAAALALVFTISLSSQAALVCSNVFDGTASRFASARVAQAVSEFEHLLGAGNTTSLRKEDKYVVKEQVAAAMVSDLSASEPTHFILRDKKLEGQKNVTVTDYARPLNIELENGKRISGKIRFRKYYSTSDKQPLGSAPLQSAAVTEGKQFLEAKIDHPDHVGVVIKPRILISDEDAAIAQSRELFLKNREALGQRWKAANPKADPRLIDNFVELFARIYETETGNLPGFAKTSYVRDSYSLMVQGADPAARPIEIQFTLDREVNVVDQQSGKVIDAYEKDDVVVEVKIPLSRAALTAEDIKAYPLLARVKEIKAGLSGNHEARFKVGAGKLSTFRRVLSLMPLVDD
jgi:hypothetical protein